MRLRWAGLLMVLAVVGLSVTSNVRAAGLVISCDQVEVKTFCSNDTQKECTAANQATVCGASATCSVTRNVFTNPCTVNTFVDQFVKLSQYALTFVVALAVLMFTYGGFQFITAGGRAQKVDEGKRVIEGTIVGLIISFTAFVIINFVVGAVTGSPAAKRNINPFGAIARVFVNPTDKNISRPFNTTGQSTDSGKCYSLDSGWDKNCTQVHCADTSKDSGDIHTIQQKLTDLHCDPQGIDGCYGPKTLEAVRRFQIANDLPPTGQVDQDTLQKLNATPRACDANAATSALVGGVSSQLPAASDSTQALDLTGCCVISNAGNSLFCANQVSQRTCAAQGGEFHAGSFNCATDPETRDTCGYCGDTRSHQCFETTTNYWCTNVVRDTADANFRMTFQAGRTCGGEAACNATQNGCAQELLNLPP